MDLEISSGNAQFFYELSHQVYIFIKMIGVKGKLSRTYFREMGTFFSSDFVTQCFLDIFREPPKSLFTNKFRIFQDLVLKYTREPHTPLSH